MDIDSHASNTTFPPTWKHARYDSLWTYLFAEVAPDLGPLAAVCDGVSHPFSVSKPTHADDSANRSPFWKFLSKEQAYVPPGLQRSGSCSAPSNHHKAPEPGRPGETGAPERPPSGIMTVFTVPGLACNWFHLGHCFLPLASFGMDSLWTVSLERPVRRAIGSSSSAGKNFTNYGHGHIHQVGCTRQRPKLELLGRHSALFERSFHRHAGFTDQSLGIKHCAARAITG